MDFLDKDADKLVKFPHVCRDSEGERGDELGLKDDDEECVELTISEFQSRM